MSLLTTRPYNARSHAALGVDIVGSSRASDDLLDPMKTEIEQIINRALVMSDLDPHDVRHFRETGDGVLLAYPEPAHGQVAELVFYIDHLLRARNRYARVPMRARVAVHAGPMSDDHRYHRTYITLSRLLTAPVFTEAVGRWCRRDPSGEKFGAAAVFSHAVWSTVVEPFHAALIPPARCAPIPVTGPDYSGQAWIHFPGLEADLALCPRPGDADDAGRAGSDPAMPCDAAEDRDDPDDVPEPPGGPPPPGPHRTGPCRGSGDAATNGAAPGFLLSR